MNGQKRVGAIVFARKKLPQLEFVQFVRQTGVLGCNFFFSSRARGRLVFFGSQLLQCLKVLDFAFQLSKRIDSGTQPGNFLDIGLSALAIRPEIWRSHSRLNRR